jgi:hypothetical protein
MVKRAAQIMHMREQVHSLGLENLHSSDDAWSTFEHFKK